MRFRIPDGETPGVLQLYACLSAEDLIRVHRSEDEENASNNYVTEAGLWRLVMRRESPQQKGTDGSTLGLYNKHEYSP